MRSIAGNTAGIADQIVSAGAHFAVQVYAARTLGLDGYGRFAVAYAVMVLCQMLHNALLAEPLVVFGAGLSPSQFRRHLGLMLRLHAKVVILACIVAAVSGIWLGQLSGRATLSWMGSLVAIVASMLTMLLFRRAFQASRRMTAALGTTLVYSFLIGIGMVLLNRQGLATPQLFFGVMAVSAALVALWQGAVLRPRFTAAPSVGMRARGGDILSYGAWAAGATAVNWLGTNAAYVILPVLSSVSQSAILRAAMNFYLPYHHLLVGITAVLLPALARRVSAGRTSSLTDLTWKLTAAAAVVGLVYGLVMLLLARPAVSLLYGPEFGTDTVQAVRIGSALPSLWGVIFIQITVLRAFGRSDAVFRVNLMAFLAVGIVGLLVGAYFGARGAAIAFVVLQVAVLVAALATVRAQPATPSMQTSERQREDGGAFSVGAS